MSVFDALVGQERVVEQLRVAVADAADVLVRHEPAHGAATRGAGRGAMTHAWLFTGPPGSGRSVAARAFAAALRTADALLFSEPNRLSRMKQGPAQDPLSAVPYDWRSKVVGPATAPPPVTPQSPLLALIDSQLDTGHREFVGSNVTTLPTSPALLSTGIPTLTPRSAPTVICAVFWKLLGASPVTRAITCE